MVVDRFNVLVSLAGRKKVVHHVARYKRLRIARELAAHTPGEPYKARRLNKDPGVPHVDSFKKHIKRREEQHAKRVCVELFQLFNNNNNKQ